MVSGVNFSMSGVNLSTPNVNVSMSSDNVSGQLLSKPVLTIPTECLSAKSLCSIINVLIEDLQLAKSRILELENRQSSTEKEKVQIPKTKNLVNVGKLIEPNKIVKSNEESILQEVSKKNTKNSLHRRSENDILHCRYCDQLHKRGKNHCPANGNTCSRCHKLNHFASTCKTKILKESSSSDIRNSPSNMELQNLKKSKSDPNPKESQLILDTEKNSKDREKEHSPRTFNPNCKRKKEMGSLENPKQVPMYPDEYRTEKMELLKARRNIYYKAQYKRSHREDKNGFIWCANHYKWNCEYCRWKSNSNNPHDLTQTRTEDDFVLRFKDVLINVKDQDQRFHKQMRNCKSCSKLCEWKCKHCPNHYCSLYHISMDDSHEAQCLQKQKAFRETTS